MARSHGQRKSDVITALEGNADLWLATAGRDGRPHLVAVSSWWDGEHLVIATRGDTQTARNLDETGRARLAWGSPADAVVIDASLLERTPARGADPGLADGFSNAAGWNPADEGPDWHFFRLRPVRIQAYRGYEEVVGRDVMRRGAWLD